jgi:hypothetical protein
VTAAELAARVRAHGLKCTELRAAMFLRDFERDGLAEHGPHGWRLTAYGYATAKGLLAADVDQEAA